MPSVSTIIYVVVGVAILVMFAAIADWFISNPMAFILIVAVIGGVIFAYRKAKQAKNRV